MKDDGNKRQASDEHNPRYKFNILKIIEARTGRDIKADELVKEFADKIEDMFEHVRTSQEGRQLIIKIKSHVPENEIYDDFAKLYLRYRAENHQRVGDHFFKEIEDLVNRLCDDFVESVHNAKSVLEGKTDFVGKHNEGSSWVNPTWDDAKNETDVSRGWDEQSTQKEEVAFTAYHPKEGKVETWHTLLVYTHLLAAFKRVQDDAKRFSDQLPSPKETTTQSSRDVLRGTEITVVPACTGVAFNPPSASFQWLEDFHRSEFRFRAETSLLDDAAKGQIDIYAGPFIIGTLKFAMLFNNREEAHPVDCEEHATVYNRDDVFISYSRKDTEIVQAFKGVLEATGFDVFFDVDDIRSGQYWEAELLRRIEKAKIFQLFWSHHYRESENCRQEWEYALKQKREEGYIRPVFWEKPLPPPPPELNKFNFVFFDRKKFPGT